MTHALLAAGVIAVVFVGIILMILRWVLPISGSRETPEITVRDAATMLAASIAELGDDLGDPANLPDDLILAGRFLQAGGRISGSMVAQKLFVRLDAILECADELAQSDERVLAWRSAALTDRSLVFVALGIAVTRAEKKYLEALRHRDASVERQKHLHRAAKILGLEEVPAAA